MPDGAVNSPAVGRWLFGKLPSRGDFISRGLDMARRDELDRWLSAEMEQARTASADRFESRYDYAPAWNFVDRDDAGDWSGGAMCASVDSVGRRFPVIMAAPAGDVAAAAEVSGACLSALCQGFVEGWDADALMAADLPFNSLPWNPQSPEWALLGEDGPALVLAGRFPQGIVSAMLEIAQ
ncbi:MAG: type VI secretion system-associated protein TagF [Novosphingobium sp.]